MNTTVNQLGRRNLTPEQFRFYRGDEYLEEKQEHGGDRKSRSQNGTLNPEKTKLGRRNLTPEQFRYFLGRLYNRRKKEPHRPKKRDQNDPVNPDRTATQVGKEHGVSQAVMISTRAIFQAVKARKPSTLWGGPGLLSGIAHSAKKGALHGPSSARDKEPLHDPRAYCLRASERLSVARNLQAEVTTC